MVSIRFNLLVLCFFSIPSHAQDSEYHLDLLSNITAQCSDKVARIKCHLNYEQKRLFLSTKVTEKTNWGETTGTALGIIGASGGLLLPIVLFPDLYTSTSWDENPLQIVDVKVKELRPFANKKVKIFVNEVFYKEMLTEADGTIDVILDQKGIVRLESLDEETGMYLIENIAHF